MNCPRVHHSGLLGEVLKVQNIGVVIIGRNEGERLKRCLRSVGDVPRVYVDSGSSDDSVVYAVSVGAHVEELDCLQPFTAARARNVGFAALIERHPTLEFVMFVDGDCEVRDTWFSAALPVLQADESLAVVCGRRRERYPERTFYNFLCDVEWNTPIGDASACGGDAVYRTRVFREVDGFNRGFIAGEEPELCFRIRQKGYRIRRIEEEMTLHDADMHRFQQWWKRSKRSGYAYFLNAYTHGGKTPEKFKRRDVKSIVAWAGAFYLAIALSLVLWSIIPFVVYLVLISLQIVRLAQHCKTLNHTYGMMANYKYAFMLMLGKVPQFHGILSGLTKVLLKRQHTLVEYK